MQKFAQSLLEVADNLESAAKAVPSNIVQQGADVPAETALKYLRSLLEGVQATERVLLKVRHCSSTGHACGCGMHAAAAWLASSVSCGQGSAGLGAVLCCWHLSSACAHGLLQMFPE
jgi:hypothetical protein